MQKSKSIASETIAHTYKIAKAKDIAIGCLTIVVIAISIVNLINDYQWRNRGKKYAKKR